MSVAYRESERSLFFYGKSLQHIQKHKLRMVMTLINRYFYTFIDTMKPFSIQGLCKLNMFLINQQIDDTFYGMLYQSHLFQWHLSIDAGNP